MKRAFLAAALALGCFAEQPHFQDAKLETRSAAGGLEAAVRGIETAAGAPAWIAYSVPISIGNQHLCWSDARTAMMLEGSKTLVVMLRVEEHQLSRIRTVSGDCEVDAGGLTVYWLTDIRPDESVAMLERMAREHMADKDRRRLAQSAASAIGLHGGAAAAAFFARTLAK